MTKAIARVHLVHLMNADWALGGRQGCEPAENWQLASTSTITIVTITQPISYSFYHSTEGKRLSRPRHCRKGAQPMPKAVYRRGYRDKHNRFWCDSNPGPLAPQSDTLTTRPLQLVNTYNNAAFYPQVRLFIQPDLDTWSLQTENFKAMTCVRWLLSSLKNSNCTFN